MADNEKNGIWVYRFDYDLNGNPWSAHIGAYSQDEAQEYLFQTMGNVTITGISQECPLHAISNNLRETIVSSMKRKPGRPPKKK